MRKIKLFDKFLMGLFIKQRQHFIEKNFNGIECPSIDYNSKVYDAWYANFKTNIGNILGIISVILGIISIFICFI